MQLTQGPTVETRSPVDVLRTTWGFDDFRPLQEPIIAAILSGRDVVALLPTGGGKSLCFQLPSVMFDGLTVVVSPLIALMKDQVDALTPLGISATFINSSLTPEQSVARREAVARGEIKLLYVAPERLSNTVFRRFLQSLNLSLVAIDEAHCISEWGHDFRPEYRQLQVLRETFPSTPLAAFTATATARVQQDIVAQLRLNNPACFTGSFNRPNLYYEVRPRDDPYRQILELIKSRPGESGIIYRRSRQKTEDLATQLRGDGVNAIAYHAGLGDDARRTRQEAFRRGDVPVIVATIAFGMGIDKPDVRFVIHHELPKNLESYYQESGRAGRDGLPSHCLLFYAARDAHWLSSTLDERPKAERDAAAKAIDAMNRWATSPSCRRAELVAYFGDAPPPAQETCCDNCDYTDTPAETVADISREAQMFLSCMIRTEETFGQSYIIDVLRGSRSAKVVARGHDSLSTHGIGSGNDAAFWRTVAHELRRSGLVAEGEHRQLSVTPAGRRVLRGEQSVTMRTISGARNLPAPSIASVPNAGVMSRLRALRQQIATENGVPNYVILWDRSLVEMCAQAPQTLDELGHIYGFGARKLDAFGSRFLAVLSGE